MHESPEDLMEKYRQDDAPQRARMASLEWAMRLVEQYHAEACYDASGRQALLSGPELAAAALPLAQWVSTGRGADPARISEPAASINFDDDIPDEPVHLNHLAYVEIAVTQLYAGLYKDEGADDGGRAAIEFERRTGEPFADFIDAGGTVAHAFEIMDGSYDPNDDDDADEVYVGGRRADGTHPDEPDEPITQPRALGEHDGS